MKTINTLLLLFSTSILLTAPVLAGTVTGLKSFTKGTPAVSADVNGNFDVIKTAVDDNDLRITTLEKSTPGAGNLSVSLTGTVFVSVADAIDLTKVKGVGTLFTKELQVNSVISIDGQINVVVNIIDDTTLELRDGQTVAVTNGLTAFTDGDLLTLTDSAGQVKLTVDNSGALIFRKQAFQITPVKMAFSRVDFNIISFTDIDGTKTELNLLNSSGNDKIKLVTGVSLTSYSVITPDIPSVEIVDILMFNISLSPSLSCNLLHSGGGTAGLQLVPLIVATGSAGSPNVPSGWGKAFMIKFTSTGATTGTLILNPGSKFEIICF